MIKLKRIINITIPVPEEILLSLRIDSGEFKKQMRMLTAMKLYENHKLSIGQSALFAGMMEEDFIKFLGENQITIFGTALDITEDYQNA